MIFMINEETKMKGFWKSNLGLSLGSVQFMSLTLLKLPIMEDMKTYVDWLHSTMTAALDEITTKLKTNSWYHWENIVSTYC